MTWKAACPSSGLVLLGQTDAQLTANGDVDPALGKTTSPSSFLSPASSHSSSPRLACFQCPSHFWLMSPSARSQLGSHPFVESLPSRHLPARARDSNAAQTSPWLSWQISASLSIRRGSLDQPWPLGCGRQRSSSSCREVGLCSSRRPQDSEARADMVTSQRVSEFLSGCEKQLPSDSCGPRGPWGRGRLWG